MLVSSTLREHIPAAKIDRDQRRGALLIEALLARYPDTLDSAISALEVAALPRVAKGANHARALAEDLSERAQDFLEILATLD